MLGKRYVTFERIEILRCYLLFLLIEYEKIEITYN